MSAGDVAHLVSMFWPDVRLKRFVEIRPADSAPLEQVLGYTALVKGLFYSDSSLAAVEDTLGVERGCAGGGASPDRWPLAQDAVDEAIANVEVRGFEASVYGQLLTSWESLLFELAREALPAEERAFLDPLEAFAHNKPWWRPERQL